MKWRHSEQEEALEKLGVLSGGCIASLEKCRGKESQRLYALKNNPSREMNEAERKGLLELSRCPAVNVPEVYAYDENQIVMSFVPAKFADANDQKLLGEMVAKLHSCRGERFGLEHDNFIGETPQLNDAEAYAKNQSWAEFYWQYRLSPQWTWAREKGMSAQLSDKDLKSMVFRVLGEELESQQKVFPSLLHGDLWSANWLASSTGVFLIDPAVSYGHWEMEFAMVFLFGGFSREFFQSYEREFNVDLKNVGFSKRQKLYRAYHLLNHYNLFGGHYGDKAQDELRQLL